MRKIKTFKDLLESTNEEVKPGMKVFFYTGFSDDGGSVACVIAETEANAMSLVKAKYGSNTTPLFESISWQPPKIFELDKVTEDTTILIKTWHE